MAVEIFYRFFEITWTCTTVTVRPIVCLSSQTHTLCWVVRVINVHDICLRMYDILFSERHVSVIVLEFSIGDKKRRKLESTCIYMIEIIILYIWNIMYVGILSIIVLLLCQPFIQTNQSFGPSIILLYCAFNSLKLNRNKKKNWPMCFSN